MMNTLALLVCILITSAIIFGLCIPPKYKNPAHSRPFYHFKIRNHIVSPAERSLLGILDQISGSDFRVFTKVRLADVLSPAAGLSRNSYLATFNKIKAKHLDFVLCDADDLKILCAIELDDKSHMKSYRQTRDHFLNEACQQAGLPLLRITAAKSYSIPEIKNLILKTISKPNM